MAELTIESGPQRGRKLSFTADDPLLIGRGDECTLKIESPGIADRHVVIKALKGGGFGVKKLDGVFLLNGRGTDAARLQDGDVLEVGDTRIRFGPRQNGVDANTPDLPGFRLIEILGQGGHGTVYRAEQLSLHREIALKVLNEEMTENPEFVGRFVAEARAAARLSHPNVVQVFDVGHHDNTYYLAMEIMEQGSLEDRLRRDKKIPIEECLRSMIDAANGLAYAEAMRIVHRDIKPDNLMVDSHGTTKIADLGLAMTDDQEQGKIVGTPHFMSPEQALNRPLDNRSDLYSLGCTFFRLVTGRTLFVKRTTKEILTAHVRTEPDAASDVDSEIPIAVSDIIEQLVAKDPEDRYQTAEDLIEDLEHALHPPARRGLLITAVTLVVLGAGYAIYWGATREDRIQIVKQNDPEAAKVKQQLRQAEAEKDLLKITQNVDKLDPLKLAARLEAFADDAKYAGTAARNQALTTAKRLRHEERVRVETENLRVQAIAEARKTIEDRLQSRLTAGDYRGAVAALQPEDIPPKVLAEPELKKNLDELRGKIRETATAALDGLKKVVETAKSARNPDAVTKAVDDLEKVLDKEKGWPDEAFADRRRVATFVTTARKDIETMKAEIAASRESVAWANFRRQALADDGILAKAHAFDLTAALELATRTRDESKEFQAGTAATTLLTLVQAAKAYEEAYKAAVAKGAVQVPLAIDGTVTDVLVKSFVTEGENIGLVVEVPGDEKTTRTLKPEELRGSQLLQRFVSTEPTDAESAATQAANRIAFLAIHALWSHLSAAATYMKQIDPKDDTSGTGENRFTQSLVDLNYLLDGLEKSTAPWRDFLAEELRATRELSRGLRAFSLQRYTGAHGYFENLKKRFQSTLAVQKVDS